VIAKAAKEEKVVALHTKFVDAKASHSGGYLDLMSSNWQSLRSQLREAAVCCMS